MMIINNTPHAIKIFSKAQPDEKIRKFRVQEGAEPDVIIPSSGVLLNAKAAPQEDAMAIDFEGACIPTKTAPQWTGVDECPQDGNLHVVSALYVSACKEVGMPTDHLLTIGGQVVNEEGFPIGCAFLCRN